MLHNTTVSHVSPLVSYVPTEFWYEGDASDPDLNLYSNHSYHANNGTVGLGKFSFSWYGTGVWIYGGYRERLGEYEVRLDGSKDVFDLGYRGDTEEFQSLLYGKGNLAAGQHEVEIINGNNSVLDLDFLVFESDLGNQTTLENSDSAFSWLPSPAVWNFKNIPFVTGGPESHVRLNFSGSAVAIYGTVTNASSRFTVAVDGRNAGKLLPNTNILPLVTQPHLLYFDYNLGDAEHAITLHNDPFWSNATLRNALHIEYAVVYSKANQSNTRLIIGLCLAAFFLLLISLALGRWYVRWRHKCAKIEDAVTPRPFPSSISPIACKTMSVARRLSERAQNSLIFASSPTIPTFITPRYSRLLNSLERPPEIGRHTRCPPPPISVPPAEESNDTLSLVTQISSALPALSPLRSPRHPPPVPWSGTTWGDQMPPPYSRLMDLH